MDKVQLQNRTKNFALMDFKRLENLLKEANELVAIFTAAIKSLVLRPYSITV